MFTLTKRRKFVLSSLILSLGLFILEVGVASELKYRAIGSLSLLAAVLTFWSLREAAANFAIWVTLLLPILFTAGVSLFYFLLPGNLLTAIPIIILYFLGMYALFLTENIFSVAAIRTINLFRSASAVGFLLTLLTGFFWYNTFISLKLPFYFNFLAVLCISFPLILSSLWSVNLEEKLNGKLIIFSFLISLFLGEFALFLSFWPVSLTMGSLFLTACLYVLLGLAQAKLSQRLFKRTVVEYLTVGVAVFLTMLVYTSWG